MTSPIGAERVVTMKKRNTVLTKLQRNDIRIKHMTKELDMTTNRPTNAQALVRRE